jgi:hypothetical protein
MSSKLIKMGSPIVVPNDKVIATVRVLESGQIQVEAPTVPPALLIKYLQNVVVDIMYASLQPIEIKKIDPVA